MQVATGGVSRNGTDGGEKHKEFAGLLVVEIWVGEQDVRGPKVDSHFRGIPALACAARAARAASETADAQFVLLLPSSRVNTTATLLLAVSLYPTPPSWRAKPPLLIR